MDGTQLIIILNELSSRHFAPGRKGMEKSLSRRFTMRNEQLTIPMTPEDPYPERTLPKKSKREYRARSLNDVSV
jgi:hypothetical protein